MIPTVMNNRKSKRRNFLKVGDFVNFELDKTMNTFRYNDGNTYVGSGKYANGIVERKTQEFIEIVSVIDGKIKKFVVANYAHKKYDPNQWNKDGFVVKWSTEHIDINCECGYGNNSNIHFLFCPRHPKGNVPTEEELKEKLMEMKWCTEYTIEEVKLKLSMEK